ncbi:hypothetical protein [Tenacibaculum maritimum]|uniref:hypothetical protein n=1 Tax=Tenacibaculum maritimum TaxID=107401 RepID=UPI001E3FF86D|nr:hypothetical protein [Tenacibaculum maritimum]MCD9586008.1 hypothetical protein [Tenacibaculum maritimum]MCD9622203.1 hypothetical protein [Tenacibaculum maritimum]MCD9628623.1 hypothetical protein [Tenacibaculum maritimum]MCD9631512.1 hypothetical protein [Tenacibaculum maritimum]MCD9634420.1 hypothetical protein [Tenacibaculum maritimum]
MNIIDISEISKLIKFIEDKNVLSFKLGDNLNHVKKYFTGLDFNEIKNKYFYLLSYMNVEYTFINNSLNTIQIEIDKPSGNCIKIADFSYDSILSELKTNKIPITKEAKGELIILEQNVKLIFNNDYLVEIYFLS